MNTTALCLVLEAEISETLELTPPELENAAGYTVKSDVRAGQCPSTFAEYKYKGTVNCVAAC